MRFFSRLPTQPAVPPAYPPNFYNPATAVPQHFTPPSVPPPQHYVPGRYHEKYHSIHYIRSLTLGHTTPGLPSSISNVPNVPVSTMPSVPSYQDSKPTSAWNDPPAVMMKVSKPNPVKVDLSLFISFACINTIHNFSRRLHQQMVSLQTILNFSQLLTSHLKQIFILIQQ